MSSPKLPGCALGNIHTRATRRALDAAGKLGAMSRRRARRDTETSPEQLALSSPSAPEDVIDAKPRVRLISAPEQTAKAYIARRAKPLVVLPGNNSKKCQRHAATATA